MLRKPFFQHALHSFNTDFFYFPEIANQSESSGHVPNLANSKKLSSSEGPLQCIEENDVLSVRFCHCKKLYFK